ncbi:hypothetical protein, partial [Streptomyces sp. NPDC017940]|uniref:hypothetical protein n=1 Tax=Streptomyces sp. NPDC017940 TaxID=3365017 RepID=UPI0037BA55F0
HPRDSLRLSSGRFPSVFLLFLRFRLYQIFPACRFDPISSVLSGLSAFRRCRLYQILSGLIPSQPGVSFRLLGRSDE